MAPTMKKILVYQYRVITARRATAVALAIRLYQIDHGSRPERLDELAAYLPSMPADPFRSDGRPLGYLPHAALAMLYSVSKDGGDDSGAFVRSTDGTVLLDESPDMVFFLDHDQASRAWRAATEPATQPASSPATTPSAATSP